MTDTFTQHTNKNSFLLHSNYACKSNATALLREHQRHLLTPLFPCLSAQYSCGQIGKSIKGKLSQRSLFEDQEETQEDLVAVDSHDNGSANATGMILLPVGNDTNLITNDTIVMAPAALTDASATTTTTVPPEAVNITTNNTTTTVKPTSDGKIPSWHFFPTLPTIKAESDIDERIVGGNEATRGEIPWQVMNDHWLDSNGVGRITGLAGIIK